VIVAMPRRLAACTECRTPLPDAALNTGALAPCPSCGTRLQVEVFPAFFRSISTGSAGETIVVEGEAGCFFHPDKKAVVHCAECGRFLCALCDLELNGRHLCPGCLESGQRKGRLIELEKRRTLYDSAALALACLPVLIWPVTLLTAPLTVILVIFGWRKPGSLVPRSRVRFVLALLVAAAQIVGWGVFFFFLIRGPQAGA
jgi:uncharacterized paraquat-inducible protein A